MTYVLRRNSESENRWKGYRTSRSKGQKITLKRYNQRKETKKEYDWVGVDGPSDKKTKRNT